MALRGEADLDSEPMLRASLERAVPHAKVPTVIDLSDLSFCDVRSMLLLTAAGRVGIPSARTCALVGMTGAVDRLWQVGFAASLPADRLPARYLTAAQAVTALAGACDVPPPRTAEPRRVRDLTGTAETLDTRRHKTAAEPVV